MSLDRFISNLTSRNIKKTPRPRRPASNSLEFDQGRTLLNGRRIMAKDVGKNYKLMEAFTSDETILDPAFYKPTIISEPHYQGSMSDIQKPVRDLNNKEMDTLKELEGIFKQTLTAWSKKHTEVVNMIKDLPVTYTACRSNCETNYNDIDSQNTCKDGCNIGQYATEGTTERWQQAHKTRSNTGYDVPVGESQWKTNPPPSSESLNIGERWEYGGDQHGVLNRYISKREPGTGSWQSPDVIQWGLDPKYQGMINAIQPSKNPQLTVKAATSGWSQLFKTACNDAVTGKLKTQNCGGFQETKGGNSGFYVDSPEIHGLGPRRTIYTTIGSKNQNNASTTIPSVTSCSNIPANTQASGWNDQFEVTTDQNGKITVERIDQDTGWGQNLVLACDQWPYPGSCDATVESDKSGYCKCLDGRKVGYVDSGHPPFTCNTLCASENKDAIGIAVSEKDPTKAAKPLYNNPQKWYKGISCGQCQARTAGIRVEPGYNTASYFESVCHGNPRNIANALYSAKDPCCSYTYAGGAAPHTCTPSHTPDGNAITQYCPSGTSCPGDKPENISAASPENITLPENYYIMKDNIKQLPTQAALKASCEGADYGNLYVQIVELKNLEQTLENYAQQIYSHIQNNANLENQIALSSTAIGRQLLKLLDEYEKAYVKIEDNTQRELNMTAMSEDNQLKVSSANINYLIWFGLAISVMFLVIKHLRK